MQPFSCGLLRHGFRFVKVTSNIRRETHDPFSAIFGPQHRAFSDARLDGTEQPISPSVKGSRFKRLRSPDVGTPVRWPSAAGKAAEAANSPIVDSRWFRAHAL